MVAKDVKAHNALVQKLNRRTLLLYRGPAMVAKDVKAHNALVQKLKESSSLQEEEKLDKGHGLVQVDDKYIAFASKDKAQHSYIPASSYQDEWVSSKDRTCSCNGSLQALADCCTFFMVRV